YNYKYTQINNRPVMQRTFIRGGANVVRNYYGYNFGGRSYYGYVPYHHFDGWYYSWARSNWSNPWNFRWGWMNARWYGHYGYYYHPYPVYYGPSYWLTDYIL